MQNKEVIIPNTRDNFLVIYHYFGPKIVYTNGYVLNRKIDVLVFTKRFGKIKQYTSILDGHKEYSPFINDAKTMSFLKSDKLTSALSENGYVAKKDLHLINFDEEIVIDKLSNAPCIHSNDLIEVKKIITKVNAEFNRRYNLLLKNTLEIELFENFIQKEKGRIAKLTRKKRIKAEKAGLRRRKKCIGEIAVK